MIDATILPVAPTEAATSKLETVNADAKRPPDDTSIEADVVSDAPPQVAVYPSKNLVLERGRYFAVKVAK